MVNILKRNQLGLGAEVSQNILRIYCNNFYKLCQRGFTFMESVPLMVITITLLEKSTLMKKGVSPTSTWNVA